MFEVAGDLWAYPYQWWDRVHPFDESYQGSIANWHDELAHRSAIVITTNGYVKRNGEAVMGRGCAKEAQRFVSPLELGQRLEATGNQLYVFRRRAYNGNVDIVTLPVKHVWNQMADPALISRSLRQLVTVTDALGYQYVVVPRPGCGNGGLPWSVVKPLCEQVLDDRFTVIHLPEEDEVVDEMEI